MANTMSNYLQAKLLDYVLSGAAFSSPATVYIALFTANPTNAGGGTEVTGGSYARVALTNNATNWPAATGSSPSTKANGTTITFTTATADWGLVTGFAIFDAASSGNMLWWGDLTEHKSVYNGDTASFAASQISITQD